MPNGAGQVLGDGEGNRMMSQRIIATAKGGRHGTFLAKAVERWYREGVSPMEWRTRTRPSLTDAKLKLSRAKKHLSTLRDELRRFRKSKPISARSERDPKRGGYLLHIRVRRVWPVISLVLGDFLNCTRSALDQLVWSLAKLTLPYPEHTYFPILDVNNSDNRRTFSRYTNGVPADAATIIESLQPYHRGDASAAHSDLLWRLHTLCAVDKHRRIPVHGDESILNFPNLPRALKPRIKLVRRNVMGFVLHIPATSKRQVRLDPYATFHEVFGDSKEGIFLDLEECQEMYDFIACDVLPRFALFFK
jgi:hypothetical protein